MKKGIIHLADLYEYIKKNKDIPHRSRDKHIYRPFKDLIDRAIDSVPEKTGWYFWIENNTQTKHIYIGKSDNNTSYNLKKRIEEELSEEYVALWAVVYDEQEMIDRFNAKYDNRYINNNLRAIKKKGVTHILWVAVDENISKQDIENVKNGLIKKFHPIANQQKKSVSNADCPIFNGVSSCFSDLIHHIDNN